MAKIIIIGAGFSSLSAASHLSKAGHEVCIIEKNEQPGGRARTLIEDGFTFDMGPSWYWMPDIFERHFAEFGYQPSDFYELKRLDPSYSIFFGEEDKVCIPSNMQELVALFESLEKDSGEKLKQFLADAEKKYRIGMQDLVRKPALSILEFVDSRVLRGLMEMQLFSSLRKHVRKHVKHPKLRSILEFPSLFLGATPEDTPALYSLMNHADLKLGTWYPMGGMKSVVDGMLKVALEQGAKVIYNEEIKEITIQNGKVYGVQTAENTYPCDYLIGGADYHHVEQELLPKTYRQYPKEYWENRTMAPSVLLFYLGIDKKLKNLEHHSLFFDEEFDQHALDIYKQPKWPSRPLFYTSCTSLTDEEAAPEGKENLVILIPIAPNLEDSEEIREFYLKLVMERMEALTKQEIRSHICYQRSFSIKELKNELNAFKGNAYGLANTLRQTAILRPSIRSKKVSNLYYTGQLTVPGPGVPPAIISGEIVAKYILKQMP